MADGPPLPLANSPLSCCWSSIDVGVPSFNLVVLPNLQLLPTPASTGGDLASARLGAPCLVGPGLGVSSLATLAQAPPARPMA